MGRGKSGTCLDPSSVSSAGTSRGAWAMLREAADPSATAMFVNGEVHMPALPVDTDQIVITASRVPQDESDTPASVTIIDQAEIEKLGRHGRGIGPAALDLGHAGADPPRRVA